jgi:tetratricopeptide (TPR) repeat protein
MDPERWQRAEAVFEAALGHAAADRTAFLARACEGDEPLRKFVARLVAAHERAGAFLSGAATLNVRGLMASRLDATERQPTLPSYRAGPAFAGTERFAIRRHLGSGGMGVVYEAFDRVRAEPVALKTLKQAKPADIVRVKREFRSLADIAHPNLVSLYELVVDDTACFFTMELVEGAHFVDHVNGESEDARSRAERARNALIQLVDGIAHLHHQGKLHRDIKPSNILVTPNNRVVILDFGLSSDMTGDALALAERMAGTPTYFAPERHAGSPPSPAQDWYSVGVTLYEGLTSRVPFTGTLADILRRQREREPVPPRELAHGVPDDLNEICLGLLRRDPVARFTDRHVRQMLTAGAPIATTAQLAEAAVSTFVGRHEQLAALREAWDVVQRGGAATVYVHGPSGIGKSALLEAFCDELSADADTLILKGRCYEHESVPYKGLDGTIDSLARYLRSLPRSTALSLLPADIGALGRIFPALAGLDAIRSAPEWEDADPLLVRQRAFSALGELLSRLARDRPVVVWIDDLHWADADSAVLLAELLRQPGAPALLMVVCARTAEVAAKPFLAALFDAASHVALPLPSLDPTDAHALISSLVRGDAVVTDDDISAIAREAEGNPFLLQQLARHAARSPALREENRSLTEVLLEPLRTLPPEAGAFLQMLALCGRPMAPELVCEASGVARGARLLVHRLRASHFLRSSGSADRVEIYHDRIQETILTSMAAEKKRRLHAQMARTLVARGLDDPEPLYEHHRGAGEHHAAAVHAAAAARKADGALAFDRAAAYYQAALELAPDGIAARTWREGLGSALANAGRPLGAADAYLAAADLVDATHQVELRRRAAEQFLVGGHIDRGLAAIRSVLHAVGLRLPATRRLTLAALAYGRARLRLRGLRFTRRRAEEIAAADLVRIDTCWSVTIGLLLVDNLRAAHFQTQGLLLALDAGEPFRVARSMVGEIVYLAIGGGRTRRATATLTARARDLAVSTGSSHAIALIDLVSGAAAFMVGEWHDAVRLCERALPRFRQTQSDAVWETALAQNVLIGALTYLGRFRELTALVMHLLAATRDSGNAYWDTELRTRHTLIWLVQDAPSEAIRQADDGIARWSHEGFHRQHYNHVLAHVLTSLYLGDAETGWRLLTAKWKTITRSQLFRGQWTRIEALYVRARCALQMALAGGGGSFLRLARAASGRIRRERMAWSDPIADLLDAAIAVRRADAVTARRLLARAVAAFDRQGMPLYAAAARRRLTTLVDDEDGARYRREADDWMAREGIVNPIRMTRLIAPGFVDPPDPGPLAAAADPSRTSVLLQTALVVSSTNPKAG